MKIIFLIGMPCSGKSTLGYALQQAAEVTYIDLDEAIEQRVGMSIAEIFAVRGEAAFREIESAELKRLSQSGLHEDVVIGCGGGTPCFGDNMDYMLATGRVVWLQAAESRLLQRLIEGKAKRPAIANMDVEGIADYIAETRSRRLCHYSRAHDTFDSTYLENVEEISSTVEKFINRYALTRRHKA
ncbi:MAG: shikimate kinase [Muribaculaceae bacterium]